jgi:drug/metabolite transporter (DMT)-like permease
MLLLGAIWGCSFLFISVGVRELHPAYLALGRVIAGSLVLLTILAVKRESLPRSRRVWAHNFVAAAIGSAIPWTLFGYGEQRVPSLLAGIWNGITPLVVLPIAVWVFRTEKFTLQRVLGLLIGFAGMMVVLGAWQLHGGSDLTGQLFCMAAAVSYGVAIPYQKRFIAGSNLSGTALSASLLLCSTVQLAIVAPILTGHAPPAPSSLSLEVIGSVLALGALGSGADLRDRGRRDRAARAPHLVPAGRRRDRACRGRGVPRGHEFGPIAQAAENRRRAGARTGTVKRRAAPAGGNLPAPAPGVPGRKHEHDRST